MEAGNLLKVQLDENVMSKVWLKAVELEELDQHAVFSAGFQYH